MKNYLTSGELKALHMSALRGELPDAKAAVDSERDRLFLKLGGTSGVTGLVVELLMGAGFDSVKKVAGASDAELEAISGIGKKRVAQIRELLG